MTISNILVRSSKMRTRSTLLAAAAMLAAGTFAAPAAAATFVLNVVLDPNTLRAASLNSTPLAEPLLIGVGDTVDLTVSFTNGATISIADSTSLWTGLLAGSEGSLTTTGRLSFIGGSSNIATSGPLTQNNEFVHAGNFFGEQEYRTGPGTISFSGIRQVFTIEENLEFVPDGGTDLVPAGPDPREYNSAFFYYDGVLGGGAAVPEPGTWALMISGFGLVGGAMRRRRQTMVVTA